MNTNSRRKFLVFIIVISICIFTISIAYAFWVLLKEQKGSYIVSSACLDLRFLDAFDSEEGIGISYNNAWPMSDEEALNKTDNSYRFIVENKCNTGVSYIIGIEDLIESNDKLNYGSVSLAIDGNRVGTFSDLEILDGLDSSHISKKIGVGYVEANQSNEHNFQIWINEDSTSADIGKGFNTRLFVLAGQGINSYDEPIAIVKGDLNTVGSEVQIGSEHFYVIGDDTDIPGNVKLLAKYNLLVGRQYIKYDLSEEECPYLYNTSKKCHEVKEHTDYELGYNRQSSSTNLCPEEDLYKEVTYWEIEKGDCPSPGVYSNNSQKCVFYENYDESTYDNIIGSITPSIYYDCKSNYIVDGFTNFADEIYWYDYSSAKYYDNYNLDSIDPYLPYIYYDQNKHISSSNKIATYLEKYREILQRYNINVSEIRLLDITEASDLGCASDFYLCVNAPYWVSRNTSFWLGNAYEDKNIVIAIGIISTVSFDDEHGVRPVISVSKSIFS